MGPESSGGQTASSGNPGGALIMRDKTRGMTRTESTRGLQSARARLHCDKAQLTAEGLCPI